MECPDRFDGDIKLKETERTWCRYLFGSIRWYMLSLGDDSEPVHKFVFLPMSFFVLEENKTLGVGERAACCLLLAACCKLTLESRHCPHPSRGLLPGQAGGKAMKQPQDLAGTVGKEAACSAVHVERRKAACVQPAWSAAGRALRTLAWGLWVQPHLRAFPELCGHMTHLFHERDTPRVSAAGSPPPPYCFFSSLDHSH